jgi:hypothetical protein
MEFLNRRKQREQSQESIIVSVSSAFSCSKLIQIYARTSLIGLAPKSASGIGRAPIMYSFS